MLMLYLVTHSRQQPETSPDPRLDRARRGQYIDLSGLGEHPSLLRLSVLTNRRRSLVFRNLEDMSQAPRRQPIFYGWWTVLACFVIMLTSSGFAFYAQGVYLDALVDQRGFPVWVASAGASTFFIVSGIIGYFTGYLIARFDVRVVMTVGTIVAARTDVAAVRNPIAVAIEEVHKASASIAAVWNTVIIMIEWLLICAIIISNLNATHRMDC